MCAPVNTVSDAAAAPCAFRRIAFISLSNSSSIQKFTTEAQSHRENSRVSQKQLIRVISTLDTLCLCVSVVRGFLNPFTERPASINLASSTRQAATPALSQSLFRARQPYRSNAVLPRFPSIRDYRGDPFPPLYESRSGPVQAFGWPSLRDSRRRPQCPLTSDRRSNTVSESSG